MLRRRILLPLLAAALLAAACGPQWETGDLLFVRDTTGMGQAVEATTGEVTHVAIVLCTDSGTYALDATPLRGVALTPIADFLRLNPNHELVRPQWEYNTVFFDHEVRAVIGAAYDSLFLPGNMDYYCSELVWDCFRDAQGRPLVPTQPMTFRDSTGQMPPYWVDWFARLGREAPEGIEGTNPQDLYRWMKENKK